MEICYLGLMNMFFTVCAAIFFTALSEYLSKPEENAVFILLGSIALALMLFIISHVVKILLRAFMGIEKKYAMLNLRCTVSWWGLILADAVYSSGIVLSRVFFYGFLTMFIVLIVWTQTVRWKFFRSLEKYHYDIYYRFCTMSIIGNKRFFYLKEETDRILQYDPPSEMKDVILKTKSCYPIILIQFEIIVFTFVVIGTFGMTHPNIVI